jgi:anti-anti-sigma regulatory factor
VGIFSIFKRKPQPAAPAEAPVRAEPTRTPPAPDTERARQREIARATAAKIDAIESAMAFDIFNEPEPAWGSAVRRAPRTNAQIRSEANPATLPMAELSTTAMLADDTLAAAPEQATSAPLVDEIAIVYANGGLLVAEQMLIGSLAELGQSERAVWWMLFDLYQAGGQQDAFDDLAIDYASRFETSPPTWSPLLPPGLAETRYAGVTPTETFGAMLDERIAPQLQRLLQLAASSPVLRLECGPVREVSAAGCALLLAALVRLRADGRELILAGAAELADTVRSGIAIGQRDASEAPWLLLLELLQLMNREKDFEETAMDYCVTYELSPPSFEPPPNVATACASPPSGSDRFMLPPLVGAGDDALFDAIEAHGARAPLLVLDCSRLARVDYIGAGSLLKRLRRLAAGNKIIELRELNHLVAALFKLMGYGEVARLFPHRY